MKKTILLTATLSLLFTGCMSDMRTATIEKEGITSNNTKKGVALLDKAWEQHGFSNLAQHKVYSFTGHDTWKGMMGKMGKPWPSAKSSMDFKYEIGTFDSQVTYLDGKGKGVTSGLQSWNYYEIENSTVQPLKMNKRRRFGLSAYHYFFEMLDRLRNAPLIAYAGEEELNGKNYDIVFATWKQADPHKENDQYKLYINKKTGILDYAVYSLRENYLKFPGSRAFYGSVKFEDYKSIDGVMIPHTQTVFLNDPKKKEKKHVHRLKVENFEFDSFDVQTLKPLKNVKSTGDSKDIG